MIEPDLRVDRRLIYGETRRVDSSAIPPSSTRLDSLPKRKKFEFPEREREGLILNFSKKKGALYPYIYTLNEFDLEI